MAGDEGAKWGHKRLTKPEVLPDMLNMKEFSLEDVSLLNLGPEINREGESKRDMPAGMAN